MPPEIAEGCKQKKTEVGGFNLSEKNMLVKLGNLLQIGVKKKTYLSPPPRTRGCKPTWLIILLDLPLFDANGNKFPFTLFSPKWWWKMEMNPHGTFCKIIQKNKSKSMYMVYLPN